MDKLKFKTHKQDLPLKVLLSFESLYKSFEEFAANKEHPYRKSASDVLKVINKYPKLKTGLDKFDNLDQYDEAIQLLTEPLFPSMLQTNDIKSIMIPFQFIGLNPTERFKNIIKNAGDDYELELTEFNQENIFFLCCSFILASYYKQPIKYSRPMFMEIPDKNTGIVRHYRILMNADFTEIYKAEGTPELTQDCIDELLRNPDDKELWRSKFPPDGYIYKGFAIMTLYDATIDSTISKTRTLFLRKDQDVFEEFKENIRTLFGIQDLQIGVSNFNTSSQTLIHTFLEKESKSLFFNEHNSPDKYTDIFCSGVCDSVIKQTQLMAIPDVEQYAKEYGNTIFTQKLNNQAIKSVILAPIRLSNGNVQMLELASFRKNELNSFNAMKLNDISSFVKVASNRYIEEAENLLESTIQENYTTIHPTVKWRFNKAATNLLKLKRQGIEMPALEEITFDQIYPLFGQSDIKGSSTARNEAIKADLESQLNWVIETFDKVMAIQPMPIYRNLVHRVVNCLKKVNGGLKAGDEVVILDFLKNDIYPVFNHVASLSDELKLIIDEYSRHIDPNLNVVYDKRKDYDNSVTTLNEQLSIVLDKRQEEAQAMYPHYFQRYNTDGVEYNMYIGGSLIENQTFDNMYLQNIRLWQLETMWDIEQRAHELLNELPHPLEVASLILVHSNPLAIKFKMSEKQFDVDGAYNARYEIVKKRIDKSYIKGTNDRLTVPNKIAIVYSQDKDAEEYLHYIKYLQSEGKFGIVEMLDIEDLQGVSGLKAIRVEVLYKEEKKKQSKVKKVKQNGQAATLATS